ncbi:ATP-binding protein [Undibacterium sp. 5I1]|nr:ATP-binding protein [Undibacterium sp. 5I1]MDY7540694.1 ATP-binding protein [Undibacterium sp. 5I1]
MSSHEKDSQCSDRPAEMPSDEGENDHSILSQRERAEAHIRLNPVSRLEEINNGQHLLHELRVHQVELEMQNEELREAQLALALARDRYFDLYDLAPVGYCTISELGLIKETNLTAASLFSMTRGKLINQPISRLILKDDQDIYYLHHKQLIVSGESQSFDLRMVNENGGPFWGHITTTLGRDIEGGSELRAVLSDVTERKQAEIRNAQLQQDLEERNRELDRIRIVADKANRAKSDFLSSMSHELRTPLHAILGFSQLLASGLPPPTSEQSQSIDQVSKAGWHLLELVNKILDLAVIDSGKITLSIELVSVTELITECEAMVLPLAQQRGIKIVVPVENSRDFILADPVRIKQILINLLSNAIKYNLPGGEVAIICSTSTSGRLRINVNDTGGGLTPAKLNQLFQPFNRLGQEAGNEGGTGIGLIVCKRLIELMGGTIGVESVLGKGSSFWVELDTSLQSYSTAENMLPMPNSEKLSFLQNTQTSKVEHGCGHCCDWFSCLKRHM